MNPKTWLIPLLLGIASLSTSAQNLPEGQVIFYYSWQVEKEIPTHPDWPFTTIMPGPAQIDYEQVPPSDRAPEQMPWIPSSHLAVKITYAEKDPYKIILLNQEGGISLLPNRHYAVTGRVRYENVSPGSVLEVWNYFTSAAPIVARTTETSGPMAKLEGTSGWRDFWLPLDTAHLGTDGSPVSDHLLMNLCLTGPGTLHFQDIAVMLYPDDTVLPMTQTAATTLPDGQTVAPLPWFAPMGGWPAGLVPSEHVKTAIEEAANPNDAMASSLRISYDASAPIDLPLLNAQSDNFWDGIVTHHFAIVGEVRSEKVSPGSYLEMQSQFASPGPGYPNPAYVTRTLDQDGPAGGLDGTSDWREFRLKLDVPTVKTKLVSLQMVLHLTGPGTVHLRNTRLVQYPEASLSELQAGQKNNLTPPSARLPGLDGKSFLLGVLSACLVLLITAGVRIALRRWHEFRHARELRRIASLDT